MRKHHWGASLAGFAVMLAASQPAYAQAGLPDAIAVGAALDATPSVRAALARAQAARGEAGALAVGPHEFMLTSSYIRRSVEREGRFNEFDAQITRPIRLPGKAQLDRQIGTYGITAADNRAEDARHQAALILAQSWWEWLGAGEQARLDQQAVANYQALLGSVQRRAQLRDAASLEVDQTRAALGAAQLAAERSSGQERLARARIAARFPTLNLPQSPPEVVRPELPAKGLAAFHKQILGRSHEIAAAEAEASRMTSLAERARRDRIADPSLGVRVFSERGGAEKGAGVVFSMPFGGSHRRALAERATAEAGVAQAELQAAHYGMQEVADGDLTEAQTNFDAWKRAREGLDAQVSSLVKMRRGHQAGEFNLAEVLLAERQVHDAFRAEAQARTDAMWALTRIRIDSHELWIGDAQDVG